MDYTVLILAAGKGSRMNLGYNKMFYPIEDDTSILDKTLQVFIKDEQCRQIILVMNKDDMGEFSKKLKWDQRMLMISGGKTRQESVANGLMGVKENVVLIHDGARCYVNQKNINDCLDALTTNKGCVLMVPCTDTIKQVKDGYVEKTYDRSLLYQAQTPQAFVTDLVLKCYRQAIKEGVQATDDAQVVEMYSDEKIKVVMGSVDNIKITTCKDVKRR